MLRPGLEARRWEFSALFLAVTVVMVVAWLGQRETLAPGIVRPPRLLASIATYLPPRQRRAEAVVSEARHHLNGPMTRSPRPHPQCGSASTPSPWFLVIAFGRHRLLLNELPCPLWPCSSASSSAMLAVAGRFSTCAFAAPVPSHYWPCRCFHRHRRPAAFAAAADDCCNIMPGDFRLRPRRCPRATIITPWGVHRVFGPFAIIALAAHCLAVRRNSFRDDGKPPARWRRFGARPQVWLVIALHRAERGFDAACGMRLRPRCPE